MKMSIETGCALFILSSDVEKVKKTGILKQRKVLLMESAFKSKDISTVEM